LGFVFWKIAGGIGEPKKLLNFSDFTPEREPIPENCPENFKELILACWQIDPSKRPSAKEIVGSLGILGAEFNPDHYILINACEELEKIIHLKRKEGLAYIAPFLTASEVEEPIENYWDKWETSKEIKEEPNPPLQLEDIFRNFLKVPDCSTLLLLGEAGLGKTLTTYVWTDQLMKQWWAYINDPSSNPPPAYFPVFIRQAVDEWSHKALEGAFLKIVKQHGFQGLPLLVFLDGYDELHMDKDEKLVNLVDHLGLSDYPNVKLIVTCRPKTVDAAQLYERFNFDSKLQTYHFLPFSIDQLLGYLKTQLSWSDETQAAYKETLQSSKSVREVLRNPFVLYLLKQSWKTLSEQPLDKLTRWKIYEGFVEHSITTQRSLLSLGLQDTLAVGYLNLVHSFQAFARDVAFRACQKESTIFSLQEAAKELDSPWVKLKELVAEEARKQFAKRQEEISNANEDEKVQKQRRALLNEKDFIVLKQMNRQQFEVDLPLKIRGKGYEFSHRSLFEYFVAKRFLQLCDTEADFTIEKDLWSLMDWLIESNSEILLFLNEGWKEGEKRGLTISSIIRTYSSDPNLQRVLTNIAKLFNAIGRALYKRAKYGEVLGYDLRALAISEKVCGQGHPSVAVHYSNIGEVLRAQAKYAEALDCYYKALAIYEKVPSKDYLEDTAKIHNNTGAALHAQSKYTEALDCYFKALTLREKKHGKHHPDVAHSYNNIGLTLYAQGKYAEALEYYYKALIILEQVPTKDHPDVAQSYNNIGLAFDAQSKYTESLDCYQKALVIWEKVYGKDHPNAAQSYNNIGSALHAQARYTEALDYHYKALAIRMQVHGKEHPDVAQSYNNVGSVLFKQSKDTEALDYCLKALAIWERVYCKDSPEVATAYNNIAQVLEAQGNYGEALAYHQKSLTIWEKAYGNEHPDVAISYNNTGTALFNQGKDAEALDYYLKSLAIYGKAYSNENPHVAATYNNISILLKAQDKYAETLNYCFKVLPILEKVYGPKHSNTIRYMQDIESLKQQISIQKK